MHRSKSAATGRAVRPSWSASASAEPMAATRQFWGSRPSLISQSRTLSKTSVELFLSRLGDVAVICRRNSGWEVVGDAAKAIGVIHGETGDFETRVHVHLPESPAMLLMFQRPPANRRRPRYERHVVAVRCDSRCDGTASVEVLTLPCFVAVEPPGHCPIRRP